ncbi:hypothetical protein Q3G72_033533 [Acer saccharum]|nr:hypothetical protein Q3G72_033533 [Acer saccharum]
MRENNVGVEESSSSDGVVNNNNNREKRDDDHDNQKVAFYKLFAFADKNDVVLMVVAVKFLYLAVATGIAAFLRTHEELISDPEGAYSQLVHLQEGANEGEDARTTDADKSDRSFEITEKSISRAGSHDASIMRRSISRGSSSSRHSFGFGYGLPAPANIFETEEVEERTERNHIKTERRQKVSIRRLAYLNKPEIPVLCIGSIGAMNYFFGVAGGKLIQRIRSLTFEKVVHQQISWFDDPENTSGAIGARLSTDASTVRSLVVSPLMLIQGYLQTKFLKGFSADAKVMYEEASQVANDAVGSIRTVASFCAEQKNSSKAARNKVTEAKQQAQKRETKQQHQKEKKNPKQKQPRLLSHNNASNASQIILPKSVIREAHTSQDSEQPE